mgnify:FL=1|jgi:hypothetical protein|tara:strand:+ start:421 stop:597 length:177 start_codon:yes stop_codon:yes gene_type:complete
MYLIIKKTEYSTLTPSYIVERNSKNKELADNLARNLNDEAQENKTNVPITYQVVEIVN